MSHKDELLYPWREQSLDEKILTWVWMIVFGLGPFVGLALVMLGVFE